MTLRVLDLFSGIGGFSLGLERAGFETVAFCEIDPFCRRVLAKHWPDVPCYEDIRTLSADALSRDGIAVDVICGGFPCQDLSFAGKRAGLEGARSGLWGEYARLIGELRPRFVIVENVPGLLSLGMGRVLGDLSALGYDATWDCVPACAVGAPHRRDRVWIVAHARGEQHEGDRDAQRRAGAAKLPAAIADCEGKHARAEHAEMASASQLVADPYGRNRHGRGGSVQMGRQRRTREAPQDGHAAGTQRLPQSRLGRMVDGVSDWSHEPADVPRVAQGVENRVDRLRALGNSVVPQIPEMIGRAILEAVQ